MVDGLVLVLAGVALIVAMVSALGSGHVRGRLYRGTATLRGFLRLGPMSPELFARRYEAGIYAGMCAGATIAIVGVLVAVG